MREFQRLVDFDALVLTKGRPQLLLLSPYELRDHAGRLLATGSEPYASMLDRIRCLSARNPRRLRHSVELSSATGVPLLIVDKQNYSFSRKTYVYDGSKEPVGCVDDVSPMTRLHFRLLDPDGQVLAELRGERGSYPVTAVSGAEVATMVWERPAWVLRRRQAVPEPLALLMVACLVVPTFTLGGWT